PKRFFLGGSTSLRGFREDGVLAEDRRAELARDLSNCRSVVLPTACSPQSQALLAGQELVGEGGELFTLGKAELRLAAYGAVDLGVFFEAGNLWLNPSNFDLLRLRYVTGAGLRYGTPVGPLALDVGFNLTQDRALNEPAAQVHFSIGLF